MFENFNCNPDKHRTNDCVVRAIAAAYNTTWESVYLWLTDLGLTKHRMPNDKVVYEELLKQMGWVKQKMPKHLNGKRYTVKELISSIDCPMLITVTKHMTYANNGTVYDTWDCRSKCVCNYWIKKTS